MTPAGADERPLLLVHVRKTGGTSLGGAMSNRFDPSEFLRLYDRPPPAPGEVRAHRFTTGHVDLSFLENYERPPIVVTCLRDPFERALSAYSFYRWFPEHTYERLRPAMTEPEYERRVATMRLTRELTLLELIEREPELASEHFGNAQVRIMAGVPPDAPDAGLLEPALAGLEHCDFVAVTERLAESTGLLTRRLGWSELGPLPRAHGEVPDRLRVADVDAATASAVAELTELDRELHRRGTERLERGLRDDRGAIAGAPADAPLLADVRFDGPVRGGGWYGRDESGDPAFAWIGESGRAWVDLDVPSDAKTLRVDVAHAVEPAALEALRLEVAGETVPHSFHEESGRPVITAPLPAGAVAGPASVTVVSPHHARPADLSASHDRRLLSVAVSRIAARS